jgi:hypothetical protein
MHLTMNQGRKSVLGHSLRARPLAALCATAMALATGRAQAQATEAAAPAGPDRAACVTAHTNAQELKRSGKLLEAQSELQICSSAGCPGAIISDCGQWIADLEQTTPSMIFEVRIDGRQVTEFQVDVDGTPVTDLSKAYKVNPGRHVVRVRVDQFEPKEETVVLPEGQRMRLLQFEFSSPKPEVTPGPVEGAAAPPPAVMERPTPVIVYPLLGLGVAGLGAFGVFTFLGKGEQDDLESKCAPSCTDSDLKSMKNYYLIGDISAGVGAAALIGAGIVYLARPSEPAVDTSASFRVSPATMGDLRSFGVSVERTW